MKKNKVEAEKATLLVVEDDLPSLLAMKSILEEAGFHVNTAQDGKKALKSFNESPPDLILSGIRMPVMDGFEFYEAIRETPIGKITPFIFLTAARTREDVFTGLRLGADAYITKPITAKELLIVVQSRLKRFKELKEGLI